MNYKKRVVLSSLLILLAMIFFMLPVCQVYAFQQTISADTKSKQEAAALEFNLRIRKSNTNDTTQFGVENMFPGDEINHQYNINVTCKSDVTLRFKPIVNKDDKLTDVLMVRISLKDSDEILYDGLIKDAPESLNFKINTDKTITKKVSYIITTYLDTSVGNEYMGEGADVTFEWWVNEVDALDNGPKTGDEANIILWIGLMLVSVCGIIFILVKVKKEGKECKETK